MYLYLLVKCKLWAEERRVRALYYHNAAFRVADSALAKKCSMKKAFQLSQEFLRSRGAKDIYAYGETPLTILEQVGRACVVSPQDHFLDLGCGRGRGVLFFAHYFGCTATGIEWVPELARCNPGRILQQHLLEADLKQATIIYLYGTCLEDAVILELIEKFKTLKAKIVTVSFSLNEYCQSPLFSITKQFTATFPWGKGEVFVQEPNSQSV